MASHAFSRRLMAVTVCGSLGVFATAMVASPAFAKAKSKKHHTTTTTKKKGSSSKGKGTTTTTTKSTSLSSELAKLQTSLKGQKKQTFFASYKLTNTSTATHKTQSITFAQQGTKALFKMTSGTIIDTGKTTLFCSSNTTTTSSTKGSSSGPETCIQSTGADPLAGVLDLFSGTAALEFFGSAEAEAEAKQAGVTVSFSTGTYAGLASKCLSVTGGASDTNGKYCVANIGILDYWDTTGSSAVLTKYSASIPAGTFTPPAGATITTIPGGASAG